MEHLVNPHILELRPYKAGKPTEEIQRLYNLKKVIKLASNENPFPVSQQVSEAIQREIRQIHLYPDTDSYYLCSELGKYNGVTKEYVGVGAGSVELIRMIIRAFLRPGETVLTSEKSFIFYRGATTEFAGQAAYREAPMTDDYKFDLDAMYDMIDENTKIIFITNPNNPTGTILPKKTIMDFIDKVPEDKIVVLDNAYHEYVDNFGDYADGIAEAPERKNLIVLRTFSKIYALAGLRIGYAIANKEIISYLARVKAPFNVTRVAQAAAWASIKDDTFKNESAALNRKNKEKLFNQLNQLDIKVVPSQTNFLMFFPGTDIEETNNRLLQEGVIIRPLQAFGVPDAMRVSVGFEEDNDFFVEKLKKILEEMR
ncbi:MAG: histidinol-phosphate transaminase [bacterium]|nr:histidinol-phosphate transaminase [bacterium]